MLSIESQNKLKSVAIGGDAVHLLSKDDLDAHAKRLTATMHEVRLAEPEKFWTDAEVRQRVAEYQKELDRRKADREKQMRDMYQGESNE